MKIVKPTHEFLKVRPGPSNKHRSIAKIFRLPQTVSTGAQGRGADNLLLCTNDFASILERERICFQHIEWVGLICIDA